MEVIDVSGTLAEAIRRYVTPTERSGVMRRWLTRLIEHTTESRSRISSPTSLTGISRGLLEYGSYGAVGLLLGGILHGYDKNTDC